MSPLSYAAIIVIPIACFVAGVMWPRFRWAPVIATSLVVIAYLAMFAGFWVSTADYYDFLTGLMFYGLTAGGLIVLVWVGALVSLIWRSLTRSISPGEDQTTKPT